MEGTGDKGLVVACFRVDPTPGLLRALGWGSLVIALGSLGVAAGLAITGADASHPRLAARDVTVGPPVDSEGRPLPREEVPLELGLALAGLAAILTGAGVAVVGLQRVWREESYLALRTDGAYAELGEDRGLVRWEDVAEVRWDHTLHAVVFERHDGARWSRSERFAGIDGPALAKRAAEIRRKALFGLLDA